MAPSGVTGRVGGALLDLVRGPTGDIRGAPRVSLAATDGLLLLAAADKSLLLAAADKSLLLAAPRFGRVFTDPPLSCG